MWRNTVAPSHREIKCDSKLVCAVNACVTSESSFPSGVGVSSNEDLPAREDPPGDS